MAPGALGGWPGMGTDGHFLGVALGLTAYGRITASGVRAGVWRGRAAPA